MAAASVVRELKRQPDVSMNRPATLFLVRETRSAVRALGADRDELRSTDCIGCLATPPSPTAAADAYVEPRVWPTGRR